MELNCSYCKSCDVLFDNKFVDSDRLCPECDGILIPYIAQPVAIRKIEGATEAVICDGGVPGA